MYQKTINPIIIIVITRVTQPGIIINNPILYPQFWVTLDVHKSLIFGFGLDRYRIYPAMLSTVARHCHKRNDWFPRLNLCSYGHYGNQLHPLADLDLHTYNLLYSLPRSMSVRSSRPYIISSGSLPAITEIRCGYRVMSRLDTIIEERIDKRSREAVFRLYGLHL